jgi:hypothetical protein
VDKISPLIPAAVLEPQMIRDRGTKPGWAPGSMSHISTPPGFVAGCVTRVVEKKKINQASWSWTPQGDMTAGDKDKRVLTAIGSNRMGEDDKLL